MKPMLTLRKLIKQLQPDILQGWMYHGNMAASYARWFHQSAPVVWNMRYTPGSLNDEKALTRFLIKHGPRLSRPVSKMIYNAYANRDRHVELGYPPEKSVIIPNGFDTTRFIPNDTGALKAMLGLDQTALLVGMAARYHEMKDYPNFFKAAASVIKRFPQAHFVAMGRHVDASNESLTRLVKTLGIEHNCHLLGERYDLETLLPELTVYCQPSAYGEGFPNSIGEAMSCGVPCVVTDVGDSAVVVGDSGQVVPPREDKALAQSLCDAISQPLDHRLALGQRARDRVVAQFSLDAIASQYTELYTTLLKQ